MDISNKKVFVLVNTLQSVNANVYSNHCHFFTYSAKNIPGIKFEFWCPERMAIDTARNTAAEMAMNMNCDYLMFLDDDVMIPVDTLEGLLKSDKDVVAGLVIIRGYPFNNMAFKFGVNITHEGKEAKSLGFFNDLEYEYLVGDIWFKEHELSSGQSIPEPFTEESKNKLPKRLIELQECDAVGFSCCLIKIDVLKACPKPYFLTGKGHTEDVYFCLKIQEKLIPKPSIFLNTWIQPGHMMNAEPIEFMIKHKMKEFYDGLMKEAEAARGETDNGLARNQAYIDACIAQVKGTK